ncbi:hypothetical protein ACIBHY_37155 [Nonomuraea sp. NPDC050547]
MGPGRQPDWQRRTAARKVSPPGAHRHLDMHAAIGPAPLLSR